METIEKIRKAYTEYVLENGRQPTSVFQFAKKLKLAETEFYNYYASFDAIEADVWLAFFNDAKRTVEADTTYQTYSVREKALAFYYTWIEMLKAQRSFVVYSYDRLKGTADDMATSSSAGRAGMTARRKRKNSQVLMPFKGAFYDFSRDLLAEGRESREVEPRPFLTDQIGRAHV